MPFIKEVAGFVNSEKTILVFGIITLAGTLFFGLSSGRINLLIFYKDDNWNFSRKENPFLFWISIAFNLFMLLFTLALLYNSY